MKKSELETVENFKIWNEYGSVEYPDQTDLLDVNLDELVVIEDKQAEVYPESVERAGKKPRVGLKLNKKAIITLLGIDSTEDKLRRKMSKIGATFKSYNKEEK